MAEVEVLPGVKVTLETPTGLGGFEAKPRNFRRDVNITARNLAAMTAGLPGDIASLIPGSQNALLGKAPTSDELVEKFGGDPKHASYWPAAIAAPGPGELKVGANALMSAGKDIIPGGISLAQALFHGTPHKFSKFELDKIGTGEGAQAYGHGLYFAESPGVAKSYQSTLSGGRQEVLNAIDVITGDVPLESMKVPLNTQKAIDTIKADPDLFAEIQSLVPNDIGIRPVKTAGGKTKGELVESLQDKLDLGHLYEVDIPDETIGKMLDWDAPLSEQPESVRRAMNSAMASQPSGANSIDELTGDISGAEFYKLIGYGDDKLASKALNEAGIPGIRFLDGSSRNVVGATADGPVNRLAERLHKENGGNLEATLDSLMEKYPAFDRDALKKALPDALNRKRNIVVFNPDDITQVKRDGEEVFNALVKP